MCSCTISSLMRSLFIKKSGIWWSLYAACHELSWRGDSKNVAQDGFDPSTLGCRILIWAPHASTAPPSWTWMWGWTLTYSNLAHLVLLRGLDVIRIFPKASAWSSHANSSTYTTLRMCVMICWIEKYHLYEQVWSSQCEKEPEPCHEPTQALRNLVQLFKKQLPTRS